MVYTDGRYLVADTEDELHDFAKRVKLKFKWYKYHPIFPMYEIWGKPLTRALHERDCRMTDHKDMLERARSMTRTKPKLPPIKKLFT